MDEHIKVPTERASFILEVPRFVLTGNNFEGDGNLYSSLGGHVAW